VEENSHAENFTQFLIDFTLFPIAQF